MLGLIVLDSLLLKLLLSIFLDDKVVFYKKQASCVPPTIHSLPL